MTKEQLENKLYERMSAENETFLTDLKAKPVDEIISHAYEIACREKALLDQLDCKNGYSLYAGIPFCPSICSYCSFSSSPIAEWKDQVDRYLDAMIKELKATAKLMQGKTLDTVYIGGGTPLVLEAGDLERVLKAVEKVRDSACEYTVEAGRPDVFTEEKLALLKNYGVTRICVNPQSFSDKTLERIGRRHTAADLYRAFDMAAKFGFEINADLIAGLTDESFEEFAFSVREAVKTGAENITVPADQEQKPFHFLFLTYQYCWEGVFLCLLNNNYLRLQKYQAGNNENVGWTKPGKACVYNIDIMEETADNLAAGANAVSKRVFNAENRIERFASQKDLKTYIGKIDEIIERKNKFFGQI